jgi:hypothetical protein
LIQDTYWRVPSNMSAISDWLKAPVLKVFEHCQRELGSRRAVGEWIVVSGVR